MGADFKLEGDIEFNTIKGWAQIDALLAHAKEVMGKLPENLAGINKLVDAKTFESVLARVAAERKALADQKPPTAIDQITLVMYAAYLKSIDATTAAYQRLRAEVEKTHEVISKPLTITAVGASSEVAQKVLGASQAAMVSMAKSEEEFQKQLQEAALKTQPPLTPEAAQHAHQVRASGAHEFGKKEWMYDVGWNAAGRIREEDATARQARLAEAESRITYSKETAVAGVTEPAKVTVTADAEPLLKTAAEAKKKVAETPAVVPLKTDAEPLIKAQKSFKGTIFEAPKSKAGWTRLENKFAEYGAGKISLGPGDELYQRLVQSGIAVESRGGGLVANKNFRRPEGMETKARVKIEVDDAEAKNKKAKITEPATAKIRFDVEAAREKEKDIISELASTPAGPDRQALILEQSMLHKKISAWEDAQADKVAARATAIEQGKGKARTEDEQEAVNAEAEHAQALINEAKAASDAAKATVTAGSELGRLAGIIAHFGGAQYSNLDRLDVLERVRNAENYVQGRPLNVTSYSSEAQVVADLKATGLIAQSGRRFGPAYAEYLHPRPEEALAEGVLRVSSVLGPKPMWGYTTGAATRRVPLAPEERNVVGEPLATEQYQAALIASGTQKVSAKGGFLPKEVDDAIAALISRVVNSYGPAGTGRISQPDLVIAQRLGLVNAAGAPTPFLKGTAGPKIERAEDVRALTDTQGAVDTRVAEEYVTRERNLSMSLTRMGRIALTISTAMVGAVASAVKAADSLDLAYGKLGQAMKSTNEYSKANVQAFKEQAIELLKLSGDSVAATLDDMSYAKSLKLTNEQIAELTPRVADISAAIGVDMQTAYKASSLALNGITTQMRRLGFYVTEGSDGLVDLNDIMKATSGVMGAAEARGKTLTGALGKLKGQAALTGAAFGETLAPALTNILGKITGVLEKWEKLPDAVKKSVGAFVGITGALIGLAGMLAIVGGAISAISSGLARIGITAGLKGLLHAAGTLVSSPLGAVAAGVGAVAYVANKVPQTTPNVYDYRYGHGVTGSSSGTEGRYVQPSRLQGGRGSGAYLRTSFAEYDKTGAPSGYWKDLDRAAERPPLSEEAQTALDSLTEKLYELHHGSLMTSQRLLENECKAMIAMGGEVAASAKQYQKEQSAELTKEAQANINERYWGIGKTDEEKRLHALELDLADQLKNGAPGVEGTPEYEEWKRKVTAVGIAEAKEIKEGSKKGWEPINIEGTNVNQLLPFIASLQTSKPKKQVLEVDVKLDGKTIKIDTSSAFSRENIDKIGRAVIQQMLANKSWSFATSGG